MSFAERRAAARAAARPPAARAATASEAAATPAEPVIYVGLVTRALAFGLDAALINAIAILTTAVVTLTFDVLSVPKEVRTIMAAAGAVAYVLWSVGYFVTFWATTGQTPGNRVMNIQVLPTNGDRLLPRRALLRFLGLMLAAIPLGAGFLLILVNDRRRGLHDILARTVVVEAPEEDEAAAAGRPRGAPAPRR